MTIATSTISRMRAARHGALLMIGLWAGSALANDCFVSSSGLVFGPYQPLTFAGKLSSTSQTSTATVSVVCNGNGGAKGSGATLSLSASNQGPGDRISTRYMQRVDGSDLMAFNLFTDANRTTVWGNGSTGALISISMAQRTSENITVYGTIPAGQNTLRAGRFLDSMIITLTYTP